MADPTIGAFTAEIDGLRASLKALRSDISKLSGGGGGTGNMMPNYTTGAGIFNNGANAATGYGNMGYGMNNGLLSALGGGAFGSKLAGVFGGISNVMGKAGIVGGAALGAAANITSMMPGMEKYLVRETGYYQAGLMSMGSLSMANLKSQTLDKLGAGNLTAVGSDATTAAILSGRGVTSGSSLSNTLLTSIGNAARFMNMSNEVAAQSMESMTSGTTSSSLLSRGIFTSNPNGGAPLKEQQIFEQFWQRWVIDKSITKSEMQDEIRRGFIGANIDSLDLDAAAKERLKLFLVAHSKDDGPNGKAGVSLDFSNTQAMTDALGTGSQMEAMGYVNPMLPAYKMATNETNYIDSFTKPYAEGFNAAADAIGSLQESVKGATGTFSVFNDQMKQLSAFMSTFMGNDQGAGFMSGGWMVATPGLLGNAAGTLLGGVNSGVNGATPNSGGGSGSADGDPGGLWGQVVPPGTSNVSADYLDTGSQWADGTHHGVDFSVPEGTPVFAAYAGKVKSIGSGSGNFSFGKNIVIDHGDGWTSLYAHLSSIEVSAEEVVKAGQRIGLSGSTGNVSGPHLHFEVAKNGKTVNPNTFTTPPSNGTGGGGAAGLSSPVSGASVAGTGFSPVVGSSSMQIASASSAYSASSMTASGVGSSVVSPNGNNVTINVTIAQASDAEALRLADLVKSQLQQDSFMTNMGAY